MREWEEEKSNILGRGEAMSKDVEVGWGHHRGHRQVQEMQLETGQA